MNTQVVDALLLEEYKKLLPVGRRFTYCGRMCFALAYMEDEDGFELPGLVYEYADDNGVITRGHVELECFKGFFACINT